MSTQTPNLAILLYHQLYKTKNPVQLKKFMHGNICIVITDEDFSKYDFSSLKTYKFEENPVDEEDECENDEN